MNLDVFRQISLNSQKLELFRSQIIVSIVLDEEMLSLSLFHCLKYANFI